MFQDVQTIFSGAIGSDGTRTGQGITNTAVSTNILDRSGGLALFPTLEDGGIGDSQMSLVVMALGAAAGGDAAKTLTITLESDVASSLASSPVVHFSSKAITGAQITAGATLVRVPLPSDDYKRYIGLRYTVSAGFTSFPVWAFITPNGSKNRTFAGSFAVDA